MSIKIDIDPDLANYDQIRSCIEKNIVPKIKYFANGNLKQKLTIEQAILMAQILAKNLDGVKTHQLRRFFTAIKNIQYSVDNLENNDLLEKKNSEAFAELQMLKPQFANAVGRIQGSDKPPQKKGRNGKPIDTKNKRSFPKYAMAKLSEVVVPMISSCKQKQDFDIFVNFFESIVAYHKIYENN